MSVPLAWLQLKREKVRLGAAIAGIGFAVLLVFMQLGFREAMFKSSVKVHDLLTADIVLVSPQSNYMALMKTFTRRRLYQALGFPGVAAVSPLYIGSAIWKHPKTGQSRQIFVLGVDPARPMLDVPELATDLVRLRTPDTVLIDRASRPEYGPIADMFAADGPLSTEVGDRRITVVGLFTLGTSFGIDGLLLTTSSNLLRIDGRSPGEIDIGLVSLEPGADAALVRDRLRASLPRDVIVLTKQEYIDREVDYWAHNTPIGFVFAFGSVMGLVVGAVIAYQVLFTDVAAHLPEYATLKAMGYRNGYLFGLVIQEAAILAALGFVPGFLVAYWLYGVTVKATFLPLEMTVPMGLKVFGLIFLVCGIAGALALRKVRSADPAEIF